MASAHRGDGPVAAEQAADQRAPGSQCRGPSRVPVAQRARPTVAAADAISIGLWPTGYVTSGADAAAGLGQGTEQRVGVAREHLVLDPDDVERRASRRPSSTSSRELLHGVICTPNDAVMTGPPHHSPWTGSHRARSRAPGRRSRSGTTRSAPSAAPRHPPGAAARPAWRPSSTTAGARPSVGSSSTRTSGPEQDRPGDREHLLLTSAERSGSHPRAFLQPGEHLEQLRRGQGSLPAVQARDGDVLGNGEGAEQPATLGHEVHPGPGDLDCAAAAEVSTVQAYRPARRAVDPAHRTGQGRLAGAVVAHDGHHLTGAHLERDAPQHLRAPVRGPQVDDLKHGALPGRSRRGPRSRGPGRGSPHRRPRRGEGR